MNKQASGTDVAEGLQDLSKFCEGWLGLGGPDELRILRQLAAALIITYLSRARINDSALSCALWTQVHLLAPGTADLAGLIVDHWPPKPFL